MANITENTKYQKIGTQSPLADFAKIQKLLQNNSQQTSSDTIKKTIGGHFNPAYYTGVYGVGKAPQETVEDNTGFPVNTQLAPFAEGAKTQPLPEGYNQFIPADEKGFWVNPSNQATARNWPSALGGGQYITDPTQPGALIKSGRKVVNDEINPGVKQKILGKLSPKLYQVDHIVPLWIGGADTLENLQILDNITHERKTAAQAVALTLLAHKKIDLNEAKGMALTWKDKDIEGLPSADDSGYVPIDIAEKYAQKWKDEISKPIGNVFTDKRVRKYFASSFKENMGKFGDNVIPDVIREPIKGFIGGTLANAIPGTEASEDSSKLAKGLNVAGNIVGTIWGLGKFAKGLSWLNKGARALLGAEKGVTLAADAMKTAGLATDLGTLAPKAIATKARLEKLQKMAASAGLLSTWGQLGLSGREAMDPEVEADLKNHMTQFFTDVAFGGLLGSSGQNLKGYARVGLGSASISLIKGDDIETTLQDAALMTALHGIGYKRGMIDPKLRIGSEEAYKESLTVANQYSKDAFPLHIKGKPVPEIFSIEPKKLSSIDAERIEFQKTYPENPTSQHMGPINNTMDALYFYEQKAMQDVIDLASKSKGLISQSEIEKEGTRIMTAFNQLKNQTLPPKERSIKEFQDLVSLGQKLKPQIGIEGHRTATNSSDVFKKDINFDKIESSNTDGKNFIFKEPTTIVGYGEGLGKAEKMTVNEMATNPEKFKPYLVGVIDKNTQSFMRRLWIEQQRNPKTSGTKIVDPDSTVRWFAIEVDPQTGRPVAERAVGYSPQAESYTKTNNVNKTYYEITKRLQHTIETYKSDPEALQTAINKDKSMKNPKTGETSQITIEQAKNLADRKIKGEVISEEEMYSILKPPYAHTKYSSGIDNVTTFKTMQENNSNYIVGSLSKKWMIGGRETPGEPRRNPENPFLEIEGMFIPGKGGLESVGGSAEAPVNKGITYLLNAGKSEPIRKKAEDLSNTAGEIVKKVSMSEQPKLPIVEKTIPKDIPVGENTNKDLTDQFFKKIVDDIEYRKVKPDSPESLEKTYMNIVNSFKVKNPGLPEKEFKNIIKDAKARATFYVQDLVDDMYKGTFKFGTEDIYKREKETIEKPEYVSRDVALAKEFGLKLKAPNKDGYQNLELDKKGNPIFSEEYLKAHPTTKGTPLDVWGSFLGSELKANKAESSLQSQTWGKQIQEMKNSKSLYSKGFAEALDKALSEKYGTRDKDGNIKYGWEGSWKLNSALKKFESLFVSKNEEGKLISEPYRNIMAAGSKKGYTEIKKDVARAMSKTKTITAKAREDRERVMGGDAEKPYLERGMSVKDPNQVQDVSNDLTPFDLLQSGLIRQEVRGDLIDRYNNIISSGEIKSGRRVETTIGAGGEKILGTKDEMNRLFTGIKKLSEYIPEAKNWKSGKRIILKNSGEPTFEEGIRDGIKTAAEIFKLKSSSGFINFEKIKSDLIKKPDGQGGPYDGQGGMWQGVKDFFTGTQHYQREPDNSYDIRGLKVKDGDLKETADILFGEISNRPGKQEFETHTAVNTAINRALSNPARYQGSLLKVLQEPAQYQSYAPEGIKKNGQVIESQYQKLKKGAMNDLDKKKYEAIVNALNKIKSGNFEDTTGGKTFYVHASDGSMWTGKTQKEAKNAANAHEKAIKKQVTNWRTVPGMPELAKN